MSFRMAKAGFAAAAVALLAASAPATAADLTDGMKATDVAAVKTPDMDRANELRAQAEGLFSQPKQWRRAARLLERSAALRPADDADAYACLVLAASLRAAVGEYATAQALYERAAARAMARGDVVNAAHAWIDAAHAAAEERQAQDAQSLVERARLLAASPLLTAEQADQITRRLID